MEPIVKVVYTAKLNASLDLDPLILPMPPFRASILCGRLWGARILSTIAAPASQSWLAMGTEAHLCIR